MESKSGWLPAEFAQGEQSPGGQSPDGLKVPADSKPESLTNAAQSMDWERGRGAITRDVEALVDQRDSGSWTDDSGVRAADTDVGGLAGEKSRFASGQGGASLDQRYLHMGLLAPPLACLMVVLSRSPAAWFPWSLPGWWVLGAMVVGTASVLAMDAAQVRKAFPNKERLPGPIGVFCSVACLWVFYYPGYYLERGKFIKPQLGPLALFGVLFALVSLRFMPVQQLPLATSPEMIQEVESAIRLAGLAAGEMTVDGHREVSFDESREIRTGECVVHTGGTRLQVEYHVEWSTDGENPVYVHAWSKELPACSSLAVQTQVQSMLSKSEEFRGLLGLEDWREEWFDATHGRRWGVCRAVLPGWKVPVRFYVEWYDRSEGRFKLTIWTSIPPSCDSETVKSSMSQLLKDRNGAVPAAGVIEQPQDFVEVEFHRETMTRVGEFTGVVGGEQRRVRFQVSEAPPGSEDPYQVVILGIRQ